MPAYFFCIEALPKPIHTFNQIHEILSLPSLKFNRMKQWLSIYRIECYNQINLDELLSKR